MMQRNPVARKSSAAALLLAKVGVVFATSASSARNTRRQCKLAWTTQRHEDSFNRAG
jgi:hypothetical protein